MYLLTFRDTAHEDTWPIILLKSVQVNTQENVRRLIRVIRHRSWEPKKYSLVVSRARAASR